jgi:lipoprotein-anchoring transpeptidase ErfK/SrfK
MLLGSPIAAQDAAQQPTDAAAPPAVEAAASAPSKTDVGAEPAAQSAAKSAAASESDAVVGPPTAAVPSPSPADQPAAAPPAPPPPPPITLVLNTDLSAQRVTVIENGKAKYTWPISSGRRGFATPMGTFHPQWASKMHYSRQYEFAPMPHAVFFHRGTAFHGTGAVGLLGQPASHGCVRLAPGNAATLFKLVHKHGYASTKVVVHGGSRSREPVVARRGARAELASARPALRESTRVTRTSPRRPSAWDD